MISTKVWPASMYEDAETEKAFSFVKKTQYLYELLQPLYPVDRIECHTEFDCHERTKAHVRFHVFAYYTNGKGEHTWDVLLNVGFGDLMPADGHVLLDHMMTHEEMIDCAIYTAKIELRQRQREWDKARAKSEEAVPK